MPLGFILDVFFGRTFLRFPNLNATLGILLAGYALYTGWHGLLGSGWDPALPVEEFAFYGLDFIAMLLAYIWADEILFRDSKVDDSQRTPRVFRGWEATLLFWLAVGAVLFGMAWLIRRAVPSQSSAAFPGYFLFLLIASIVPSLFCARGLSVHQLACAHPQLALCPGYQRILGSVAGRAVWLVGLRARPDARDLSEATLRPAD